MEDTIQNGSYQGVWGGYIIQANVAGKKVEIETRNGVRGFNIPVTVTFKDGHWSASHKGNKLEIKKVEFYTKQS